MAGFLDKLRKKIIPSVWNDAPVVSKGKEVDDKIALGVLLWVVAESDEKFLPSEEKQIQEILQDRGHLQPEEMPYVLRAIDEAARERIDLYHFTREVSHDLPYAVKVGIIENLFRVACADGNLANIEIETIRKISGLLGVDHKEFIEAKLKVKKEFNLPPV